MSSHIQPSYPYQVRDKVNQTVASVVAWSIKCSSSGVAPLVGFCGEQFPANKYRHGMAGHQLAKGWRYLDTTKTNCDFEMAVSFFRIIHNFTLGGPQKNLKPKQFFV